MSSTFHAHLEKLKTFVAPSDDGVNKLYFLEVEEKPGMVKVGDTTRDVALRNQETMTNASLHRKKGTAPTWVIAKKWNGAVYRDKKFHSFLRKMKANNLIIEFLFNFAKHMRYLFTIIFLFAALLFTCSSCKTDGNKKNAEETVQDTSSNPTLNSLSAAIKVNPGNPKLYEQRAQILLKDGKYDDALKDMYYCLNMDSMNVKYYFTVADIYIEMNDSKKAILSLQKGIEIDPKNTAVKVEAGRYCLYINF